MARSGYPPRVAGSKQAKASLQAGIAPPENHREDIRGFMTTKHLVRLLAVAVLLAGYTGTAEAKRRNKNKNKEIVHDAEYYVLEAQNGEKWAAEDEGLDAETGRAAEEARSAAEHHSHHVGRHGVWRCRDSGHPAGSRVSRRPISMRWPTKASCSPGCTPRSAARRVARRMTGRYAVRSGMYNIGMLLRKPRHGRRGGHACRSAFRGGYATAFHGKWHLGDIEESYPHNQGFDEAFFTGYNQILSLEHRGRGARAMRRSG